MIPTSLPSIDGLRAVIVAIIAVLLFGAGWSVNGWRHTGALERLKREHAQALADASTRALKNLIAERAHGDALARRVVLQNNQLTQINQEKDDALRRLTVGRRCLDRAAVRVLNAGPDTPQRPVHEAAGELDRTDAAFATDTDVGTWIATCQQRYDSCRSRLDAIADFYSTGDGQQ